MVTEEKIIAATSWLPFFACVWFPQDVEHYIILSYALSPNRRLLAMAHPFFSNHQWAGKNLLWDIEQDRELVIFELKNDLANEIIFSPDGSRFFAAGGYGIIYIYAIPI